MLLIDVAGGYKGRLVVDAAFEVGPGVTALVGPNGSGKTTLLRLAAGVLPAARRRVAVEGAEVRPGDLAYLPTSGGLDPHMLVRDELEFYWQVLGGERRDWAVGLLGLKELMGEKVGRLSHGQRRRVELAIVFSLKRRVYLLDEPLKGLDVQYKDAVLSALRELGPYVIFTTHEPEAVEKVAQWVVVIRGGKPSYVGALAGLRKRAVIRARRGGEVVTVESDDADSKAAELAAAGYTIEEISSAELKRLMT
ncbi:ATP-binding cassette domain-containing protein [Pyrobaculum calidifontis]|uniref:ABC transporter related protein n=1 Tax=Pyrobaculum calidifontis (strain DSM 21063 / JCM 11548 / VA1) TaxID=410359 RepID=A3MVT6_PYRCJ|nr:ABC transporter ATP-binding protein [Pyrobaculum calidifontis]ABO08753.1 ABC transporter related protein [Pyrobaculum calidifontis JCM 11548]